MAKDPAMLFYSKDFLMGAMTLNMEERGQYITLICVMHQQGRLSIDEMNTVLMCEVSKNILKKFRIDESGKYYSERLEEELSKRKDFTQSRRKSLDINNGDMVHLYIIKSPDGVYKIGSSKYPYLRIKEVIKYRPGSEFYWISEGLVERENEKKLHEKYADKKEKYDWFYLNNEDLENIVRTFRTVNGNANKDVNDNSVLIKKSVENSFPTMPLPSDAGDLPDIKINSCIELLKITKQVTVEFAQVQKLWPVFLAQNVNGTKYYANVEAIHSHFINWIKTQKFESSTKLTGTPRQNGQALARQRLREQGAALFNAAAREADNRA